VVTPPPAAGALMQTTAAALAANVTAMVQNGQNSVTVRLDPPELGSMSIRVAIGHDSQVNVLMLAAVPQTAHVLSAGADDLRQAFAGAGITLGQLNIGGGGASSGGSPGDRGKPATPGQLTLKTPNSQSAGVRAIA
jgi:flagellar hook-length control protein FliK